MGFNVVHNRLLTRDGGASTNDQGLPFYLTQLDKNQIIKSNKTHTLRIGQHNKVHQTMQQILKPRQGSYILDRMNAN